MSAFIVNRKHIAYLVHAGLQLPGRSNQGCRLYWYHNGPHELYPGNYANAEHVGQVMWNENIRSVLYRYPGDTKATAPGPIEETYQFSLNDSRPITVDPVQTLKACACYAYQSCEHPEWEQSEAYAILRAIERAAINELPGYEKAEWEIQ